MNIVKKEISLSIQFMFKDDIVRSRCLLNLIIIWLTIIITHPFRNFFLRFASMNQRDVSQQNTWYKMYLSHLTLTKWNSKKLTFVTLIFFFQKNHFFVVSLYLMLNIMLEKREKIVLNDNTRVKLRNLWFSGLCHF